ncbi:hypothetical protein [Psychrobacter sp. 4Dc]|nr:hypothetical protein [Psychrobacter sp. 4Dc]
MLDSQTKKQASDLPLKAGESSGLLDAPTKEHTWMLFIWAIVEWLMS